MKLIPKHIDFSIFISVRAVLLMSLVLSIISIIYSYQHGMVLAYGDSESHLNIAKRVTHSLTPGLAQLGGIWLPLPHILMVPFTALEVLYRTGLAGSAVSSIAFIFNCLYTYKLVHLMTKQRTVAFVSFLVFGLNPNILYLQTTAMTELPLIAFFLGSIYYFAKYLHKPDMLTLICSAVFSLAASLSRYDGWFLVLSQAGILTLYHVSQFPIAELFSGVHHASGYWKRIIKSTWSKTEGYVLLFSSVALCGIIMWMVWDWVILHDPLYFTNSPFSAKSQQQSWLGKGELPAYHNLQMAVIYYAATSFTNIGAVVSLLSLGGFIVYLLSKLSASKLSTAVLLLVPFIFYIVTLYAGQSVIFIPNVTPDTYEWNLFNVRYGVMMIPAAAFFVAYFLHTLHSLGNMFSNSRWLQTVSKLVPTVLVLIMLFFQSLRFVRGQEPVISMEDGVRGLSSAKIVDAQFWLKREYDGGLVLIDDYARTLSIIRSGLPMQNVIYVGTKPYWEESLDEPEKYARWIVMQKDDSIWTRLYDDPVQQGRVYKYFEKAYTSPTILIFKRNDTIASN